MACLTAMVARDTGTVKEPGTAVAATARAVTRGTPVLAMAQ